MWTHSDDQLCLGKMEEIQFLSDCFHSVSLSRREIFHAKNKITTALPGKLETQHHCCLLQFSYEADSPAHEYLSSLIIPVLQKTNFLKGILNVGG